ncbi:MAG TPA: KUP/HAK/KT family potassium transporter [Solirubrobacteraceae bacterium]|jgi:KUP system potassium uptake protein
MRRSLNEAAHKLGYWPVRPEPRPEPPEPSAALRAASDDNRDVVAHAGRLVLALGALGIVYGDIGTSPLYTVQTIFQQHPDAATPTPAGVYGAASLIFWSLMIVVGVKYAGFIMRAHNRGDGGIMALTALIERRKVAKAGVLILLGIFGAGLFFGDGMITPAISVVSAVEGLGGVSSSLSSVVVPIALGIMVVLFAVQRFGTGGVGWMFGPVILLWFVVIGVLGGKEVVLHPGVLQGLSPHYAIDFLVDHGSAGFLTLGAVVLCVTGAEALYADRGHFGAGPIRFTWFFIVFPAVLLSYLGQGALILAHPHTIRGNPFYNLVPHSLLIPMVVLATLATIIASQAAITGSFSVARQAVQLGFLPRLNIRHTSQSTEGQIYVPVINWLLAAGVVALIVGFQHSSRLTEIYGVAVTGTFALNTILFLAVARALWHTPRWRLAILGGLFLIVELAFFSANLAKIKHGAYLSLLVGLGFAFLMITWRKGREIVTRNRLAKEGPLDQFLDGLCNAKPPLSRVPGTAIFLNPGKQTTPLALRAEVERINALHEKVVIVSLDAVSIPYVDPADRFSVEHLGRGLFKVVYLTIRVGYRDRSDVPEALALARKRGLLERNLDLEHASYLLSRITITPTPEPGMSRWRKHIFLAMARNAGSPIELFGLPADRTVSMGSQVAV